MASSPPPDDSLEWLFPLGDINHTSYPDFIKGVGALAMGSATYEWMLRHVVQAELGRRRAVAVCAAHLGVLFASEGSPESRPPISGS